jgi:CubicO group peptidase (beta-lactamase class C family)
MLPVADTEFLRSDELPDRTAAGYLPIQGVSRTNVFHLPVRGSGDGGIYSTAADISVFWRSLFAGAIVSSGWVSEMTLTHTVISNSSDGAWPITNRLDELLAR